MDPEVILSVCLSQSRNYIIGLEEPTYEQQMPIQAPWSGRGINLAVATLLKMNDLRGVTL